MKELDERSEQRRVFGKLDKHVVGDFLQVALRVFAIGFRLLQRTIELVHDDAAQVAGGGPTEY